MRPTPSSSAASDHATLADRYAATRRLTVDLVAPLTEEDCCVQSQTCSSPTKWHLGHTTWFFERFVVRDALGLEPYSDAFEYVFNSYYNTIGNRQPRARRGVLTRPGLGEVLAYRDVVDDRVERALREGSLPEQAREVVELGLNHEQQHQELLLMDIKHLFSCNPLGVEYASDASAEGAAISGMGWVAFDEGVRPIGQDLGTDPRVYDNEGPGHRVFLEAFELADRLVTNRDYLEFVLDNGYERPEHWLDLGWQAVQANGWQAPLYWSERDGDWLEFTLSGWSALELDTPVAHLSLYEADAYARWAGARLPTECELEAAWDRRACDGAMLEDRVFHPSASGSGETGVRQLMGDLWEWTSSSYGPYPGYAPPPGAVGEYNGKFMCNQYVLRGGCCVTPRAHLRPTYRNFYEPEARWAFSGVRLARSV